MPAVQITTQKYLRTLQIVHVAIVMGVFVFSVVASIVVIAGIVQNIPMVDKTTALLMGGGTAAVFILVSRLIFSKQLESARKKPLLQKTGAYRTACMIRVALLDAAAIISIVLLFLNGYVELVVFPAIVLVYMVSLFPSKKRVLNDLQPDFQEMQVWDNPDEIVSENNYSGFAG